MSFLCEIFAIIFFVLMLIYLKKENKEKSAIFSGIATLACALFTIIPILDITVPKPIIKPLDGETRIYSDGVEVELLYLRKDLQFITHWMGVILRVEECTRI